MRAVGARRRQVALVYLRTALLLGALGALVGVVLGILLANLLAELLRLDVLGDRRRLRRRPDRGARQRRSSGVLAPPLAALPAIRRGVRVDLREALEATGSAVGGQDAADRLLRRAGFLPRTMQIGLRSVGRRKRRSLATALIVALAVGNLLAVLAIAAAATESSRTSWGDHLEDVQIWTGGRDALRRARAARDSRDAGSRRGAARRSRTRRARGRGGVRVGRAARAALPLPALRRAAGSAPPRSRRSERVAVIERNIAAARRRRGGRPGRRSRPRPGLPSFRIVGMVEEPAGGRDGALRPADDAALGPRPAGRRQHLLDQDDLARRGAHRPHDDAPRGPARRARLRRRDRDHVRRRARRDRGQPARSPPRSPCSAS